MKPLWPESKAPVEVSHAAFAILARRRGWTVDFLTERFAGRFGDQKDPPRRYFERILHEPQLADVVVPYNCLIDFYRSEAGLEQQMTQQERRCGCGCGWRIFGRSRFASPACRKRSSRTRTLARSEIDQNPREKPLRLQGETVTSQAGA